MNWHIIFISTWVLFPHPSPKVSGCQSLCLFVLKLLQDDIDSNAVCPSGMAWVPFADFEEEDMWSYPGSQQVNHKDVIPWIIAQPNGVWELARAIIGARQCLHMAKGHGQGPWPNAMISGHGHWLYDCLVRVQVCFPSLLSVILHHVSNL